MRDYASVSFWLESSADDLSPRPALDGTVEVDVAILGAGYTGLWTAYYLLAAEPSLKIAVVETEIAGYGASGRNGAWCAPGLNISLGRLERIHGADGARRSYQAVSAAVEAVGQVAAEAQLDIDWRRGGQLTMSRGPHETPALVAELEELERFELAEDHVMLDSAQLRDRLRVDGAEAALYAPGAATLHPGKLVRGLARLVERMGGTIYEGTTVSEYRARGSGPPTLVTATGDVRARVIVLAGEAYLTSLRPLHRALIPVWSQIVLTEPLPDELWQEIGWTGHELIGSPRLTVVYLSRTADGRLLFGGRGAPYRYGSVIHASADGHGPTRRTLQELARQWFPALRGVTFSHAWGGPLGMPRDWHPTITYDEARGIASARGYVGHGVATSNLAGHTLAELITDRASERTELPLVGHRSRDWEPEPLRWLGVRFAQAALARVDRRAERTGRAPSGRSIGERLARH